MVLSLFLSRVLGLVREMVIAWKFGAGIDADAYRLSFQLPDLLFFLIAGGALSSAFIPVFSEYLHTDREKDAWHVFSVVTTLMSVLVLGFIVFAWVFAGPLSQWIAPEKPEVWALMTTMSRIVLPAQYAFFIGGLMFGTLYARQVFAVPGLGPNIYNLGIIFGAVALSAFFTPGVIGMSWGALGGAILGNLIIPYWVMRKLGSQFRVSFDFRHPGVRKVFRLMLPVVLGLSLPGVYAFITQYFGAFYQTGINASLDYATKLMQAPLGVFGQALAIGIFPALSQFYAQKRMDLYRTQIVSTLGTALYLTIPLSAMMIVLAPEIVRAFYEGGQFTPQDTQRVADMLRLYAIGIPAWCMHPILMRGFFALQSNVIPVVQGTLTTAVFVTLILILRQTQLGYLAMPLAGSLAALFLVAVMTGSLRKKTEGLDLARLGRTCGVSLVGSVVLGVALWGAMQTPIGDLARSGRLASALTVAGLGLAAFWAYYFYTLKLKLPETRYLDRILKRGRAKSATPS